MSEARFCCGWILLLAMMADDVRSQDSDQPLSPERAAATMQVPEGFQVSLFAGEPDVQQPISFCIDDRGRLWVAEAYSYPNHASEGTDRIVILEDADGDGRFDKRSVFYDKLNYVTGIEVGFGGVWVMSPPYFYFFADKDENDIPDGRPRVLLDGFGTHANAHNLANGFAWGPDGWLYGTHGRTNWSMIGRPGTPDGERIRFDGGVYRYHPTRHVWEPFADGTTNPWGIDWNDYGEAFVCNCVNPHLFHVIEGAHYEPWRNRESSRYAYARIPTIADHLHFVGGGDVRAGIGSSQEDVAGGGHAHCGTMIYLGDNWPRKYRNNVFMNNIHGKRINNDLLHRSGSGYRAGHGPDLMRAQDSWFMGVTLLYGPDGSVFVSDWSDTGECHSTRNTRRQTGRIYKISYGNPRQVPVNVGALSNEQLVQCQSHDNDWYVRHARRLLQERFAAGQDMSKVRSQLQEMFRTHAAIPRKLRALWALQVSGGLESGFLIELLSHESEYLRKWAIRLLCEEQPSGAALRRFAQLASHDESPFVRLQLASSLQRLEPARRWPVVEALAGRAEDVGDANLPLMIWYAAEPLLGEDGDRFVKLAARTSHPLLRLHAARRIAEGRTAAILDLLLQQLALPRPAIAQANLLDGILKGLEGTRRMKMPESWPEAYRYLVATNENQLLQRARRLALIFSDPVALAQLREEARDVTVDPQRRSQAITALVASRIPDLAPMLLELVADRHTRRAALRGLAEYDHADTVGVILKHYREFDRQSQQDALGVLASRRTWAVGLIKAIEGEQIPASDLSAYVARQLQNLNDPRIMASVARHWGDLRSPSRDNARIISRLRKQLTQRSLSRADLNAGRQLFQKTCANCHRFFGQGTEVGPDITGAQRNNLDYLLENIVDPSASVAKDYRMQVFQTVSGRTITGLVRGETDAALTIQTANEKLVVPVSEIEQRVTSKVSLMPRGLLQQLSPEQIRDLIGYLMSERPVQLDAN